MALHLTILLYILLIATVAVLIALFSRRAPTPGLSEIMCPIQETAP